MKQKKQYCLKFKDNFIHEKTIKYDNKSFPNRIFSITFQQKESLTKFQDSFDEDEMNNCLQKIYDILDKDKTNDIIINASIKEEITNELKQNVLNNQQYLREKKTYEEIPDKEKNQQKHSFRR